MSLLVWLSLVRSQLEDGFGYTIPHNYTYASYVVKVQYMYIIKIVNKYLITTRLFDRHQGIYKTGCEQRTSLI